MSGPVDELRPCPSPTLGPAGDPAHPSGESAANGHDAGPAAHADGAAPEPDAATVAALGTLSEAVEWIERARGALYDFHQLTGHADMLLGDAADELERAGHHAWAAEIRTELVGRNVLEGRWTFQVVDEYDDTYWGPVRAVRRRAEAVLAGGRRHLHEAAMKQRRRTHGRRHHEAAPGDRPESPTG
ncbi:MAG: hypothetical protein R2697_19350 [Ilumatobacteraceae bacterium]